jgi:hypothetical protein
LILDIKLLFFDECAGKFVVDEEVRDFKVWKGNV